MNPVDHVVATIGRMRDDALAQFGWTLVELAATPAGDGRVALQGTVAARSLIDRVRNACGPSVILDVAGVQVLSTGRFVAVPSAGIALFRRPDRVRDDELATELDATDGPVEWVAALGEARLVRACDGTVGWTRETLGAPVERPALVAAGPVDSESIARAWSSWLAAPYRLGGTRRGGVDCSGLVQRLLGRAGMRLPRHSTDQLAIDPQPGVCADLGTIVAIWADHEAPCHVGLAVGDGQIVHASRSRAQVIVEPEPEFVARARRVAHVPLAAVEALQRRASGITDLLAVLRA